MSAWSSVGAAKCRLRDAEFWNGGGVRAIRDAARRVRWPANTSGWLARSVGLVQRWRVIVVKGKVGGEVMPRGSARCGISRSGGSASGAGA